MKPLSELISILNKKLPGQLNELPEIMGTVALEEFDKNFDRQAFFSGERWKPSKRVQQYGGSTLIGKQSGRLRRSLRYKVLHGQTILILSAMPYAGIHNTGGTLHPKVTPQMRKYAWAMYYRYRKAADKNKHYERVKYDRKTKEAYLYENIKQRKTYDQSNTEAGKWKGLALTKKERLTIKVEKRQYAGTHPELIAAFSRNIQNAFRQIFRS